ncbi:peroxidase family protein [Parasphingorhabdus cellanae]|uniref:Peroxidase n=1 Tax=Parasphingorhabdus cellanae TaxID=2806553 RepID=A0ABX7T7W2_9SPHN|nr:heme peroxidase family protein [Parasphingorhabdus cellanae]QTD57191.1 hypothetical protein J4G78_06505 [Parasphingorhabdus cellanae]
MTMRMSHGEKLGGKNLHQMQDQMQQANLTLNDPGPLQDGTFPFSYMFPNLQNSSSRLIEENQTVDNLLELAKAIAATPADQDVDGPIPAAYTYFGQFIDHDLTLDISSGEIDEDNLYEILKDPTSTLRSHRSPFLELDSIYNAPAPRQPEDKAKMLLDPTDGGPLDDPFHDLPRENMDDTSCRHGRVALTGDPRNDENLVVGQLHVAFLRAHNALVNKASTGGKGDTRFIEAQGNLVRLYQSVIVNDYLPRICDREIVADVFENGPSFLKWSDRSKVAMPLEFSAAAFRFGHSMVRGRYGVNDSFPDQSLEELFTFTSLSGSISGNLPDSWRLDWDRFSDRSDHTELNMARKIDARIALSLANLQHCGEPVGSMIARQLSALNLVRGYRLRLPTGQAVADCIGTDVLQGNDFLDILPPEQKQAVSAGGFHNRTPLWYYILAESGDPSGVNGNHLGSVGSRIVAETFWNILCYSRPYKSGKSDGNKNELPDILKMAGV